MNVNAAQAHNESREIDLLRALALFLLSMLIHADLGDTGFMLLAFVVEQIHCVLLDDKFYFFANRNTRGLRPGKKQSFPGYVGLTVALDGVDLKSVVVVGRFRSCCLRVFGFFTLFVYGAVPVGRPGTSG